MLKTIFKIAYIAVMLVLAVLFGVLNYNTGADDAYIEIVNKANKAENCEDLVYAFSSWSQPYDANPYGFAKTGDKENEVSVYGSLSKVNVSYYENEEATEAKQKFEAVEFVYYIFIRYIKFDYRDNPNGSTVENKTGVRFYNTNGDSYDYYFVVSESVNSDNYVAKPLNSTDAILKNKRRMTTTYKNEKFGYDFMLLPLSESMVTYIKTKINNQPITSINVLNNVGETVFNTNMTITGGMDFNTETNQFFKDIETYKNSFNDYAKADASTDEGKAVQENAKKYVDEFKLESFGKENYKIGLRKDEVYTAGLVWRVIGIVALFVLAFAILYFLFFHFAFIKRLVFRRSTSNTRYVPNKPRNGQYQPKYKNNNVIDAKAKEVKPEKQDSKKANEKVESKKNEEVNDITSNDNKEENE